jgi:predicted DNA-binding ribbon-helix-helix protein
MQAMLLDRRANRRQRVPSELVGQIAQTRSQGIKLCSVFRFSLQRYAGQILPSQTAAKTSAGG